MGSARRMLQPLSRSVRGAKIPSSSIVATARALPTASCSSRLTPLVTRSRFCPASETAAHPYSSRTAPYRASDISSDEYHKLSDRCLDSLTDCLEVLTEEYVGPDAEEFEAEYSSGVLNLRLGSNGTYVINKQPPNKQIWLSSPRSGPKRFDYDRQKDTWFMIKEGELSTMRDLLENELSDIFGKPITVDLGQG
ncbi:Frataxin [Acaromyces ingoldii]|uniref:ferroxidase n=1 Tax=Acaromyces ingoldii TaxID=215250 RepID=A0A316YFD6_9BASI|nr:Frataxin [Acaromyces ingoldii]PWN87831.1 Frataxin [Acaromyces ingoldii]